MQELRIAAEDAVLEGEGKEIQRKRIKRL